MKEKLNVAYGMFGVTAMIGMTAHAVGFVLLLVDKRCRERQEILDYVRSQKKGGVQ